MVKTKKAWGMDEDITLIIVNGTGKSGCRHSMRMQFWPHTFSKQHNPRSITIYTPPKVVLNQITTCNNSFTFRDQILSQSERSNFMELQQKFNRGLFFVAEAHF